jgi:hypothetical protein
MRPAERLRNILTACRRPPSDMMVVRDYGMNRRDEAPQDSRERHG